MNSTIKKSAKLDNVAAKRCPDYDKDCADVRDHVACWMGGEFDYGTVIAVLEPINGYCPYVFGMKD